MRDRPVRTVLSVMALQQPQPLLLQRRRQPLQPLQQLQPQLLQKQPLLRQRPLPLTLERHAARLMLRFQLPLPRTDQENTAGQRLLVVT